MKIYREIGSLYIVNRKDAEGYERPVYEIEVDEAEPIRHGRWEYVDAPLFGNPYGSYKCDCCGNSMAHKTNYCPNCGAKMDKETE